MPKSRFNFPLPDLRMSVASVYLLGPFGMNVTNVNLRGR